MKPTIGRIVHVASEYEEDEPSAAIVVHVVDEQTVDVQIFQDRHGGIVFMSKLKHESVAGPTDLFWRWPPRDS